jgi:Fe2+ or Zn2+ uptake regulation protein
VVQRHVTAEELHGEPETSEISVSLASVYNKLHQFTEAGLLRETVAALIHEMFHRCRRRTSGDRADHGDVKVI